MDKIEFNQADVSKDDVNARCDYIRHKIIEFLSAHGEATVFTLAKFLSIPPENVRSHTKLLITMKCLDKRKEGTQTYYKATGKAYSMTRREDIRDEDAIDSHYAKLPIQPMQYSMDNGLDPMQLLLL